MRRRERLERGQQRVDGRLVRADDDPAAPYLLQLADRLLGIRRQPHQPRRVIPQQHAGLGQRAVARRPVEKPIADLDPRFAGWPG